MAQTKFNVLEKNTDYPVLINVSKILTGEETTINSSLKK